MVYLLLEDEVGDAERDRARDTLHAVYEHLAALARDLVDEVDDLVEEALDVLFCCVAQCGGTSVLESLR